MLPSSPLWWEKHSPSSVPHRRVATLRVGVLICRPPCPYPWPRATAGPWWVETTSVYLGNALIQRPLTEELAQLLDLSETWGPGLIHDLMEWDRGGATPPLRMCVELFWRLFLGWEWAPCPTTRHQL